MEAIWSAKCRICCHRRDPPKRMCSKLAQEPVELVLHDPLHDNSINVGDSPLPMGADIIIPLAFRLAQYPLSNYEFSVFSTPRSTWLVLAFTH